MRLTEFYLFLSIGGVLGGMFNALLAPLVFPGVSGIPAGSGCCMLFAARDVRLRSASHGVQIAPSLALLGLVLLIRHFLSIANEGGVPLLVMVFCYVLPALALLNFSPRRWRFAIRHHRLSICPCRCWRRNCHLPELFRCLPRQCARWWAHSPAEGTSTHNTRSNKNLLPGEETLPLTYYSHDGPFGRFFAAANPDAIRQVAVIGLGRAQLPATLNRAKTGHSMRSTRSLYVLRVISATSSI